MRRIYSIFVFNPDPDFLSIHASKVCEDQCIAFQLMQIAEHTVYHLSTSHFWWVAKL